VADKILHKEIIERFCPNKGANVAIERITTKAGTAVNCLERSGCGNAVEGGVSGGSAVNNCMCG